MPVANADIAKVFDEIADLLEIEGENPFRVRAYRNAARLIEGLGVSISEMIEKNEDLTELPGIGKDLAGKIREIAATGTCGAREELRKKLPATIITLLEIPGLGPKRVQTLYRELDISTPEQLYAAVRDGKVRELPGFGEKTERLLRQALGPKSAAAKRFLLAIAAQYAEPLKAYLAATPGVNTVVIAGSYRRAKETVGDIDIVVTARQSKAVMERFCGYPEVERIAAKGETRATVLLKNGLQVDLRVVPPASFGAALYYFTGSKAHNVAARGLAQRMGLKINEYGVFRGRVRLAGDTEEAVLRAIGLPYIPPELRENQGEIEAAQAGKLPRLVARGDLQGDLHVYAPTETAALPELVEAARARGLRYLGLTLRARGWEPQRVRAWSETVDRANRELRHFVLLKAIEADIRNDGTLDASASMLREFDLVIAAVHGDFDLPRARQTERLLRALADPQVTMLAHPAGRVLGSRAELDVEMPRIIRAAAERGCWLELNSRPERLDLPDVYCRVAKDERVLIAINSGAQSPPELDYLTYGVGQARRGWLERNDVVNTRTLDELRHFLKRSRTALY